VNWYTLYTKPHAERQVSESLQARNIESYLPLVQVWRARRRQMEDEPLFPCYLFARIDLEVVGISEIAWLPGLRHIVGNEEIPTPVPDTIVAYIRRRLQEMGPQEPKRLKEGDTVHVIEGPFKDLDAIFEQHLSGYERAQVLVKVLGRLTRYNLPTEWLNQK
jgi:transcriptional antiterminator RfaH